MNRSFITAALIGLGIVAWMVSGQIFPGDNTTQAPADASEAVGERPAFRVRAAQFKALPRRTNLTLRGRAEALRIVAVKAETEGRVTGLPIAEGSLAEEGAVLCEIDQRERPAMLAEAKAEVRQRQLEHKAAQDLSGRGFQSQTQMAEALTRLEGARAKLRAAEIDLNNTQIRAPFTGILDGYAVEVGDLVSVGDDCAVLVDQAPFLVVAQVSEIEVGRLTLGAPATAVLATGQTVEGRIRLIGTRANEATRTFRLEIEIPNPERTLIRDGVTADIRLAVDTVAAHRISPALLTLNAAGSIGVRTIVEDRMVRFRAVTIVGDEGDGVWVTGLPEEVTIIVSGQEFVIDGQTVDVEEVEAEQASALDTPVAMPAALLEPMQ